MKKIILATILFILYPFIVCAQSSHSSNVNKDANNPLASIKSLSFHNIYSPSLYAMEGTANTMWVRYAQPIGRVLIRASMPVNTVNVGELNRSGLGDFNVFGTYILTNPTSPNQLGVGPILSIPTATSRSLGSGKWQIGAAFVGYFASNDIFQCGVLATWQHSFAGDGCRSKVHAGSIQPFLMWQLGKGLYMRSSAITILDFENGNYLFPLGLGMGKVVSINKTVCNLFVEPQFAAWSKGSGLPKTQVFIGVNTQF